MSIFVLGSVESVKMTKLEKQPSTDLLICFQTLLYCMYIHLEKTVLCNMFWLSYT
jgi:hypothetical protein